MEIIVLLPGPLAWNSDEISLNGTIQVSPTASRIAGMRINLRLYNGDTVGGIHALNFWLTAEEALRRLTDRGASTRAIGLALSQ